VTTCSFRSASRFRVGAAALILTSSLSYPVWPAPAEAGEERYVVVVSPDVEVQNMSLDNLRRVFLFREKYWGLARPVHIILPETQLEPGSFLLDRIYRMDYGALRRLILENLYQGNIDFAPRVVASEAVAVDYVAAGHGLVTFVRSRVVAGRQVRVVSIDGVPPDAHSYSLRR